MTALQKTTTTAGRPLWAVAVVLAVLFLTFFAFPTAVVEWVGEHCEGGPACEGLLATATAGEDLSRYSGVAGFFEGARGEVRRDLAIEGY